MKGSSFNGGNSITVSADGKGMKAHKGKVAIKGGKGSMKGNKKGTCKD